MPCGQLTVPRPVDLVVQQPPEQRRKVAEMIVRSLCLMLLLLVCVGVNIILVTCGQMNAILIKILHRYNITCTLFLVPD